MRLQQRVLRVLLALVILLLVTDTGAWLVAQQLLDHRVRRLQAAMSAAGWEFTAASRHRGGWPVAASLAFDAPGLRQAGLSGGPGWSGTHLTAALSIPHPADLVIHLQGGETLLPSGPTLLGAANLPRALRWRGNAVTLVIPLQARARRIGLSAERLQLAFPTGFGIAALRIRHLQGTLRWTRSARALGLAATGVELPADASSPGCQADAGTQEMSLVGPLGQDQAAAARAGVAWNDRLRAWRGGGGRLLVSHATLQWPHARLDIAGTASIDASLRPEGAFSLHILGADALLQQAGRCGIVTAAQATSIRAVLGLIAAASDAPHRGSLDLPLELHAGTLSLGRIPLLQLPALAPPATAADIPMPAP